MIFVTTSSKNSATRIIDIFQEIDGLSTVLFLFMIRKRTKRGNQKFWYLDGSIPMPGDKKSDLDIRSFFVAKTLTLRETDISIVFG